MSAERPGRRWRRLAAGLLALAVLVAGAVLLWPRGAATNRLVAHFTAAVGISAGSDVRILGVRVGRVVSVEPQGSTVRVEMTYDAARPVPADASAVIIPPSVVSDRYVQLTPAYSGGPRLADGADLPPGRTAGPMELDDVYRALDRFNQALGPNGANRDGALSDLVGTGAANLGGNGRNLHDTLAGSADTLRTLANGRADLFGTVANLQQFVTALAQSDQQVRQFNDRLAAAGEQLAADGPELAAMLRALATALGQVTSFLRDNRALLVADVGKLGDVASVLVRQQQALIEVLDVAPLALSNLNLAYNARSGTLDTRDDAMGAYGPAGYVCSLAAGLLPAAEVPPQCVALARTLAAHKLPLPDNLRRLIGLPPASPTNPAGTNPAGAAKPTAPALPAGTSGGDPTLGGILRGNG